VEFVAASEHALKIAKIAAQAAYDKKAENIVLLDEERSLYDLERLWSDCPHIPVELV
jgi:ribosomal silencing factor RsfS